VPPQAFSTPTGRRSQRDNVTPSSDSGNTSSAAVAAGRLGNIEKLIAIYEKGGLEGSDKHVALMKMQMELLEAAIQVPAPVIDVIDLTTFSDSSDNKASVRSEKSLKRKRNDKNNARMNGSSMKTMHGNPGVYRLCGRCDNWCDPCF
jgi:hypothetical protein